MSDDRTGPINLPRLETDRTRVSRCSGRNGGDGRDSAMRCAWLRKNTSFRLLAGSRCGAFMIVNGTPSDTVFGLSR